MNRPSELVSAGAVTIETYVDGPGGSDRPTVVVLPSYGRDGGADFDEFAVTGIDLHRYWAGGKAPILELIAELDPFHQRPEWDDLRAERGDRVTTTIIEGASHALFPEQPEAVTDAVLDYLATLRRGSCVAGTMWTATPVPCRAIAMPNREVSGSSAGRSPSLRRMLEYRVHLI